MALLIDVRDPEEYATGHADGAISMPVLGILYGNLGVLADIEKSTLIELYCHSGGRAERARKELVKLGYTNVINLGGLKDVLKRTSVAEPVKQDYWFRPARFWRWFAFYYPSSRRGWGVTLMLLGLGGFSFSLIDSQSHSVSDTLINFAPWAIALMAIYDMLCFRHGEYPYWWQKPREK